MTAVSSTLVSSSAKPKSAVPKPASVRVANKSDKQALYDILMRLYQDNWLGYSMSPKKVWETINECCDHKGGLAGIIEEDGKIVGTVGIFFATDWYSEENYLREHWLFVAPEARKGRRYAEDLAAFCLWYRDQMRSSETGQPPPLVTGVASRIRLTAKIRWWARWGKQIGAVFIVEGS